MTKDEDQKKAVIGMFVLRGSFALNSDLVLEYLDFDSNQIIQVKSIIARQLELVKSDVIKHVIATKYTTPKQFLDLFDKAMVKAEIESHKSVEAVASAESKKKLQLIVSQANQFQYRLKYGNAKATIMMHAANELREKGYLVGKRLLMMPRMPLVSICATVKMQGYLQLKEGDLGFISEWQLTLLARYSELCDLYDGVETNERNELRSAESYYIDLLRDDIAKADDAFKKRRPELLPRLRQFQLQITGASKIFLDFDMSGKFGVTQEQMKLYSGLSREMMYSMAAQRSAKAKPDREWLLQDAQASRKLSNDLYNKILSADQRKKWDEMIGEKIPDAVLNEVFVAYRRMFSQR